LATSSNNAPHDGEWIEDWAIRETVNVSSNLIEECYKTSRSKEWSMELDSFGEPPSRRFKKKILAIINQPMWFQGFPSLKMRKVAIRTFALKQII
jgi:hypothetical protein